MSTKCKGICVRHKFKRGNNGGCYVFGAKRCQVCCIFIDWPGIYCPCCSYQLRLRPHNAKQRQTILDRLQNKNISKIRYDLFDKDRRLIKNGTITSTN